ncbi:ATP-binding cassette domain-containing protein [Nocardia sp. NPDC049190]|uniref:ATP-binding cassette domain-containing protein n=1 Tax=Nocardia sp. NPDC049190 TaxID=3155650 RepID=UPI0033D8EE45
MSDIETRTGATESGVSGVDIVLDSVTKRYLGHRDPAMDSVSLTIPAGEIVDLVGPSGCGKTTTMRMINRLIESTSGTITIGGRDASSMDPDRLRRGIGYSIQQAGLFPHMAVGKNIATVPGLVGWHRKRISTRVDEMLELVGLDPASYRDHYPRQLHIRAAGVDPALPHVRDQGSPAWVAAYRAGAIVARVDRDEIDAEIKGAHDGWNMRRAAFAGRPGSHAAPGDAEQEREADVAAEFLTPSGQIQTHLPNRFDVKALKQVSREWGVSLKSLVYRSRELGTISDASARRAYQRLNHLYELEIIAPDPATNYPGEVPSLLAKAFELAESNGSLTAAKLAHELRWNLPRLRLLLGQPDERPVLRLV